MFPMLFIAKVAFIVFIIFGIGICVILKLLGGYFKGEGQVSFYKLSRALMMLIIGVMVLSIMIIVDAKYIEPNWIAVKKLTIESPYFSEGLKDLKIIQITDLHVEKIGFREKQLIKIIKHLKPDVILINGDYINSPAGWSKAFVVLSQLEAKYGIYSVLGNTDRAFGSEKNITEELNRLGIDVLISDNRRLDFGKKGSLWLAGLSDKQGLFARDGHYNYVDSAFNGIPLGEPKILMIHDPDHAEASAIRSYRPQLILAGDTHGGQVGFHFIRQFSDYANRSDYMAGLFDVNGMPLYVNRGIGMKTLNIRFFCRPEITVIKLVKKS